VALVNLLPCRALAIEPKAAFEIVQVLQEPLLDRLPIRKKNEAPQAPAFSLRPVAQEFLDRSIEVSVVGGNDDVATLPCLDDDFIVPHVCVEAKHCKRLDTLLWEKWKEALDILI